MITLELDPHEASILHMILQSRLSSLVSEIDHTDTRDFREQLKKQASIVEQLLARLPGPTTRRTT